MEDEAHRQRHQPALGVLVRGNTATICVNYFITARFRSMHFILLRHLIFVTFMYILLNYPLVDQRPRLASVTILSKV